MKIALVTGATRGIGYSVAKQLLSRIPTLTGYLTARDDATAFTLETVLGGELESKASSRARFVKMDVEDQDSINRARDRILGSHDGLDILVNNAAIYLTPNESLEQFPKQVP